MTPIYDQMENVNLLDKYPTKSINALCGLSLLSWDLIIGAGLNIQSILTTTVLLLDVTCVGGIFEAGRYHLRP